MHHYFTAAVVGLGRIGSSYPSSNIARSHTAAYVNNDRIRMIAGVDPNPRAQLEFRNQWGNDIKIFSSVNEMVTSGLCPDIVSLCTSPNILEQNVKDFIGCNPKAYFLEKPAISNEKQCIELVSAIAGTPAAINYHRCWDPKHKAFFKEIKTRKIFTIRVLYSKGIFNYASHVIALLVQNFGEVTSVNKISNQGKSTRIQDESHSFSCNFDQEIVAIFQGVDNINYDLLEIDFITDKGIYSLKSGGCRQRVERPINNLFYENYSSLTDATIVEADGPVEGLSQAVDNIVNFLDKKTNKIECDLQCAVTVFKLINEINKQGAGNNTLIEKFKLPR